VAGRIRSIEISIDIGNRTCNLPACSIVPPTTIIIINVCVIPNFNICFAIHFRSPNLNNSIQKVVKCDDYRYTLVRLHYHTTKIMADVT
jgi:hypothetical protein